MIEDLVGEWMKMFVEALVSHTMSGSAGEGWGNVAKKVSRWSPSRCIWLTRQKAMFIAIGGS